MISYSYNDIFYVCSLIEFIARKSKNKRGVVVMALGESGIRKQLDDAPVNHCLSFEQVSDEIMEFYHIPNGDFDTITGSRFSIPSYTAIGGLYSLLVKEISPPGHEIATIFNLFKSFLSDRISNFSSDLYYQNPSYLVESYKAGKLLD